MRAAGRGQDRGSASHGRCETGCAAQIARHPGRKCRWRHFQSRRQPETEPSACPTRPGAEAPQWKATEAGCRDTREVPPPPPPGLHTTDRASGGRGGRGLVVQAPPRGQGPTSPALSLPTCRARGTGQGQLAREAESEHGSLAGSRPLDSQFPLVFHAMARGLDTPPNAAAPVSKTPAEVWPDSGGGGGSSN